MSGERGGTCQWCGHVLERTHLARMAGALIRRHCDRCAECDAAAGQSRGVATDSGQCGADRGGYACGEVAGSLIHTWAAAAGWHAYVPRMRTPEQAPWVKRARSAALPVKEYGR